MRIIIFLFFIPSCLFSQLSLESNFNRNGTANNQTLTVNYSLNKLKFGVGLKYLYNKENNFPQSVFYKRTYWALNNVQHLGASASIVYTFWSLPRINFGAFYDFQFTKSAMRFETYYAHETLVPQPQSEFDYTYIKHSNYIQPVLGYENNIGIDFTFEIMNGLYFHQRAGVGMLFFKELDQSVTIAGAGNWVFTEMLSVGLGWKFKGK